MAGLSVVVVSWAAIFDAAEVTSTSVGVVVDNGDRGLKDDKADDGNDDDVVDDEIADEKAGDDVD